MTVIDDELRIDAEENAREMQYIRENLPAELKEKFSDADILYIMDATVDYYLASGVLDAQPDKDGFIDIDLQKVADSVCQQAREESHADYDPDEVFFIVQADLDFQEQSLE